MAVTAAEWTTSGVQAQALQCVNAGWPATLFACVPTCMALEAWPGLTVAWLHPSYPFPQRPPALSTHSHGTEGMKFAFETLCLLPASPQSAGS